MAQNSNFRAPPREKTIMDYPQLKLTAPKEGGMERNPSMMIYVHPNKSTPSNTDVRFVVFTQTPDQDPKKQKIEVRMGLLDAITVMKAIQDVARSTEEKVESIVGQSYRPKDFKNRAAGNLEDVKLVVGKNENGVFLSLISWNSEVPRKRFFFGFGDMFNFIVNNEKGQSFDKWSALRAIAHSEVLETYMKKQMEEHWRPWSPDNKGNSNGGGGNGNYQNNYQSGGNQSSNNYQSGDGDLDDIFG